MGETNRLFSKSFIRKSLVGRIIHHLMGGSQGIAAEPAVPQVGPKPPRPQRVPRRGQRMPASAADAARRQNPSPKPGSELIRGFLSTQAALSVPTQIRCACVCAIKDEAPYIHEYVHHHLFFGFSPVIVILNRTSDASRSILERISEKHPEVICMDCDWVDLIHPDCSLMQRIAYAYGISYLRRHGLATHALLSDADEFWYTMDFETKIDSWVRSLNHRNFDQVSFPWHNQNAPEKAFEPPFRNDRVQASRTVKSIVRVSSPILEPRPHYSLFEGPVSHIDSRGLEFRKQPRPPYQYGGDPEDQTAFVLHRIQRSEDEYLISLVRGNPKDHKALKDNRLGYVNNATLTHGIAPERLTHYWNSLEHFVSECGLAEEIARAREIKMSVLLSFEKTIEGFLANTTHPAKTLRTLRQILTGTRYSGRWD